MGFEAHIKKQLHGFSLDVSIKSKQGPLGILGASGSGKSMVLKSIAGLETPDKGTVEVNGRILFDSTEKINCKPQKRKVGYLFQNYALFPHMTIEENIACALKGKKREKQLKIEALLKQVRMEGYGQQFPSQLSGGQQQRAALARIIASEPELLLLDEPFSALDYHLKEMMQWELSGFIKNYPGDVVLVTHNRDEVYQLSQELLVLEQGKVAGFGKTKELFENPEKVQVARLTGCKNITPVKRKDSHTVEALEWGCTFLTKGLVPMEVTHIGIRAHHFFPCSKMEEKNVIAVDGCEKQESPFEWNYLFQKPSLCFKIEKRNVFDGIPKYLKVNPEHILLLEGGEEDARVKSL